MTANMGDSYRLVEVLQRHFEVSGEAGGAGKMRHDMAVELGVHCGRTSALLLRAFPLLTLYMIDAWATYPSEHPYRKSGDGCSKLSADQQCENMQKAIAATAFAGERARIIRKTSQQASATWGWRNTGRSKKVDFVFVDASHDLESVRKDIAAWWPHVASGGLLCGHDWNHPRCRTGRWGVDQAVCEFSKREGVPFSVEGSIWLMAKP